MPDLWQREAVQHLRAGRDVVVHAPTGAGKTFVFETIYAELKGQAVFTVPTRALANDKLAEWTARGWEVGPLERSVCNRRKGASRLKIKIDKDSVREIALRARGTPRIALKILKRVRQGCRKLVE